MQNPKSSPMKGAGRPPKYSEPSRPVTVTLPDSVIEGLGKIDQDRGKAIVKLTQDSLNSAQHFAEEGRVEVVKVAENTGLVVIGPSAALSKIPFLHLIEVAPGRFLLALAPGNNLSKLEVAMHDVLEEIPDDAEAERALLTKLLEKVKSLRRSERLSIAEIIFVALS